MEFGHLKKVKFEVTLEEIWGHGELRIQQDGKFESISILWSLQSWVPRDDKLQYNSAELVPWLVSERFGRNETLLHSLSFLWKLSSDTVDGRNPAPPNIYEALYLNSGINYQPQLVNTGFLNHQQYLERFELLPTRGFAHNWMIPRVEWLGAKHAKEQLVR